MHDHQCLRGRGAVLPITVQHGAAVLVELVVFKLDKVVEEAGPGLCIVVEAEVTAHARHKVEKHVPRVTRYAPHLEKMENLK
jgi:hypothetical protein